VVIQGSDEMPQLWTSEKSNLRLMSQKPDDGSKFGH
jgi:hypothetical protein